VRMVLGVQGFNFCRQLVTVISVPKFIRFLIPEVAVTS
jgi:hypothetical protein